MFKKILLPFFVVITSCANYSKIPYSITYLDNNSQAQISPYVNIFMSKFWSKGCRQGYEIKIQFYSGLPDNFLGLCNRRVKTIDGITVYTGDVYINPLAWENFGENDKKTLIYHELGHCVLGLNHDSSNPIMSERHYPIYFDTQYGEIVFDRLIAEGCKL